jgi:bifunctional non-homologous end joining protein LigD
MSRQLGFIEPQLLTSVDQPPQGDEWLHEIKHDGYRTLLVVEAKQACADTRTGLDWTSRYPGIVSAALKLDCRSAIRRRGNRPGRAWCIEFRCAHVSHQVEPA